MATKYKYLELTTDEERQPEDYNYPFGNQLSAASYVASLLKRNDIVFAFIGGFAMRLRSSPRSTQDIDVCVQTTMLRIWRMTELEERLMIPDVRTIEGVFKMFIRTGPGWDHCKTYTEVEVDLVLPGRKSSPKYLKNVVEEVKFVHTEGDGNELVFPVLNVRYMLKTKFWACGDRGVSRDISDIRYLVNNYADEVRGIASELDDGDVSALLGKLDVKDRAEMEEVLGW